jgi:hypothetical protein
VVDGDLFEEVGSSLSVARIVHRLEMAGVRVLRRQAEEVTRMNNAIFAACGALALASTMTLSAQTPTPTPAPPAWPQVTAPAEPGQKPAMGVMTMTGCLKAADATMATTPADARYVLANAAMDRPLFGAPPAAAPGTATPPAHPMAMQYTVVAGTGVDLTAHVNHQVRLTGTVAGAHAGMPGMMPGDKPMTTPAAGKPMAKPAEMPAARPGDAPRPSPVGMDHMGADKGWSTFTASSITMISATCSATR